MDKRRLSNENESGELGDAQRKRTRGRLDREAAQTVAAIVVTIIVPLWLGARHVHPLIFLVFAPLAGLTLTLGVRFIRRVRPPFNFDRFVREAAGRALVIFLVGGLAFILGSLLFRGGSEP